MELVHCWVLEKPIDEAVGGEADVVAFVVAGVAVAEATEALPLLVAGIEYC